MATPARPSVALGKGKQQMKRVFLCALVALGICAASASASASSTVSANVDSIATITGSHTVVFDFDLFNCPAGELIVIVDWTSNEPSRPDSGAATAGVAYGLSNGDSVQHLTLDIDSSSFLAGEAWIGSGHIACGEVVVPVAGNGRTKSLNGV
jgi:hypothetical protein